MESLADFFGTYRLVKPGGKVLDERATLIKYFCDELKREPKVVGIRLAHYTLDQLYGLQSSYKDRLSRNGEETARKYWWAITRTTKI